jgi:hypothetical protein
MGEIFAFTTSIAIGRVFFSDNLSNLYVRVIYSIIAIVTLTGVLVSAEAAAILGLISIMILVLITAMYHRMYYSIAKLLIPFAFLIIFVVLFPPFRSALLAQMTDLFSIISGAPNYSTQSRFRSWSNYVPRVLTVRPLIGFGQMSIIPGSLDNEYIQRLYYTGLGGLIMYIYLLFTATKLSLFSVVRDNTGFVIGYVGVVGVMIGSGIAAGVLHSAKSGMFFIMCSALIIVILNDETAHDQSST